MNTQSTAAPAPAKETELPPEPTFTLRARDVGTDEALVTYHSVAKARGGDPAHLADVEKAIVAFRDFPVSVAAGVEPLGSKPGSSIAKRIAEEEKARQDAADAAAKADKANKAAPATGG